MANRFLSFRSLKTNLSSVLLISLAIGSSGFINFWDIGLLLLLTSCLLVAGWVGIRSYNLGSLWKYGSPILVIWIIGIVIFSPFYLGTAESQVQWPPIAPVEHGSRLIHFASIWSILLIIAAPVVLLVSFKFVRVVWAKFRRVTTLSHGEKNLMWRPAWLIALMSVVIPWFLWALTHIRFNESSEFSDIFLRLPVTGSLGLLTVIMVLSLIHISEPTRPY